MLPLSAGVEDRTFDCLGSKASGALDRDLEKLAARAGWSYRSRVSRLTGFAPSATGT